MTLIIYGVMILGLLGAIWAGISHVEGIGADKVKAEYSALIEKCDASKRDAKECADEWTKAVDANVSLQADVEKLRDERQACSDSVAGYELETAAARGRAAVLDAKLRGKNAALETDRDMAVRWALTPRPDGQTCEQTLFVIDSRLRALAVREAAERPDPAGKVDVKVGK